MIIPSLKDKKVIDKAIKDLDLTVQINGRTYYIKDGIDGKLGLEYVIQKLAEAVGIKCAKYVMVKGYKEVFSIDLNEGGAFTPASKAFGIEMQTSLYDIWTLICQKYPRDTCYMDMDFRKYPRENKIITTALLKIYLFDIIINNFDRNRSNWGIREIDGILEDVYILDNENALNEEGEKTVLTCDINPLFQEMDPYNYEDFSMTMSNMDDLLIFLKTFDNDSIELFLEMLSILSPEFFKQVLDEVEEDLMENGIYDFPSNYYLDLYIQNYQDILQTLEKVGLGVPQAKRS